MTGTKQQERDPVVGATIVALRDMTDEELAREGWEADFHGRPTAIELSTGAVLYPSRDEEGNGGGALFGFADGKSVMFG